VAIVAAEAGGTPENGAYDLLPDIAWASGKYARLKQILDIQGAVANG
jgi:hypothetical protein